MRTFIVTIKTDRSEISLLFTNRYDAEAFERRARDAVNVQETFMFSESGDIGITSWKRA